MKSQKRIGLLLALVICFCAVIGGGVSAAFADDAQNSALTETYSFVDLPYRTGYSNFGYYKDGYTDYTLKVGLFDTTAENYNLKPFDTWNNGNLVSLSSIKGISAENWKWSFARDTSVVLEIKSKIEGTVQFDFSSTTLGGWFDGWPSVFGLYKYDAETQTVSVLKRNFQDENSSPLSSNTYNHTVSVKTGDIVYFEIGMSGSDNTYNVENLHTAKIIVTPTSVNSVIISAYGAKLDKKISDLTKANYASSDWETIEGIVSGFKTASYDTPASLLAAYNKAVSDIDAIKPDALKDKRTSYTNDINSLVESLSQGDYTEADWTSITTARSDFIAAAEECETEDALKALYDEKVALIKGFKAIKQTFNYLDYPSEMNSNGYEWIKGDVFSTKLYAGTVSNLKEFDSKGGSDNIVYNADLNAGYTDPVYYAENWRWFIGYNAGVIVAYKAEVNLKLDITNVRMATRPNEVNGWNDDCTLTYYIVRGENVKAIKTINAPTKDEDWSGTFYLQAGDILYIEYNSTVINPGELRNTQAPCDTTAVADSTAFNADLYAEQNNDLSAEMVDEITAKKALLVEYMATLNESDYSATNWLTLTQYVEAFESSCENAQSVEEVVAAYNAVKSEMEAIKTIAQVQEELQTALQGYVDELQAEYDKLIANNKYSAENREKLDGALASGKSTILACKSKTAGNQEKIKAIAALNAIEVQAETSASSKGCVSSLTASLFAPLAAIAVLLFVKKREE